MNQDLKQNLTDLIQAAVDLANAVEADLNREGSSGSVSYELVEALIKFKKQHDELDTVLDILNGIN